jgi:hypothetical protein
VAIEEVPEDSMARAVWRELGATEGTEDTEKMRIECFGWKGLG